MVILKCVNIEEEWLSIRVHEVSNTRRTLAACKMLNLQNMSEAVPSLNVAHLRIHLLSRAAL